MKFSRPKGTFDILPEESFKGIARWKYIEHVLHGVARDFGFLEVRTPIFEPTGLFIRSAGEESDIVSKEMYTFEDKGKRSMTLRPEGTAPVMRAYIENHLQQRGSVQKLYSIGPFFRYDRPQAGRYRQFHQFSVEAIGVKSPEQDVEVIDMVIETYARLGLKDIKLLINSIGEKECRLSYIEALKEHLRPNFDKLSADSQTRFEKNPLRILDSKDATDQKLLKGAPKISEFLSKESQTYFDRVCSLLTRLEVPYEITPDLVRGLDYYCHTVFEITAGELGAQNSIGGGGRYDGLIKDLGGPEISGMGFGLGMERILLTLEGQNFPFPTDPSPFFYLICLSESAMDSGMELIAKLRKRRIPCDIFLKGKKVQKGMQIANQLGANFTSVLGDDELESETLGLKNMASGDQTEVAFDQMVDHLDALWREHV
ncbi:MAG: histidine--tRNA ligase [Simkaniaceae bacterium]|nr:histidine--tRNA ligase [Simkaniaceae bacterium]